MEDRMNFKKITAVLCALAAGFFLLPACSQVAEDHDMVSGNVGNVAPDFEGYYDVGVSENGYYFWEHPKIGHIQRLMFLDRESGKIVPLCNKPDCTHEDKDCNAYFNQLHLEEDGLEKAYLQYYEGSLYAVGCDAEDYATLYRIHADGSEWESCIRLYRTDYSSTGMWSTPMVFVDDGRVYFVNTDQKHQQLQCIALEGGDAEVIFDGGEDAEAVNAYRLKKADGYLYYQAITYLDDSYQNYHGGLYQYDASTGQSRMVKEGLVGPYSVRDGQVYYVSTEGLCRYSIQEGSTVILADLSMEIPYITLTEEYIAVFDHRGSKTLILYDYEGKALGESSKQRMIQYFGGDSGMIFGECADDSGSLTWYALNLDHIDESMQWVNLENEYGMEESTD